MDSLFNRTILSLEHSFTCEMIASELNSISGVLPLSSRPEEILAIALEKRYSQIALANDQGCITHFISVSLEEEQLSADPQPISLHHVIAGEAPIRRAPQFLSNGYAVLS